MADEIRNWSVDHEGGDFAVPPQDHPYSVVPTPAGSQCVLYTTKPNTVLAALSRTPAGFPCGVIGRCGLPLEDDLRGLEALAGNRRFMFVGDVDPCDLLIFAWLRSRIDISFRGLNDLLYERCGVTLDDRGLPGVVLSRRLIACLEILRVFSFLPLSCEAAAGRDGPR